MKLRTFDHIRRAELLVPLVLELLAEANINPANLSIENIDLISKLISDIAIIDIITSFRTQTLTKEYKELEKLYGEVITKTAELTKEIGLQSPVEIFALYVYLYRSGYLSYNHAFKYDTKMKDFAMLQGLDVVRGSGVCRSISALLTDLYRALGYDATNVNVYTNKDSINTLQQISDVKLNSTAEAGRLVQVISAVTNVTKGANHVITSVKSNGTNILLDPTNDGMFTFDEKSKKLHVGDSKFYTIPKQGSQILFRLLKSGHYKSLKGRLEGTISSEIYVEEYQNALNAISLYLPYFIDFYENNKDLYQDIYKLSESQRGLVGRLVPFGPRNF